MKIYDLHCDALLKLYENPELDFSISSELEVNIQRLIAGEVKVQFFAIFLEPDTPSDNLFDAALKQVDLFHRKILDKHPQFVKITDWEQLNHLAPGEIGAVLTLEGADAFGNDIAKWRLLHDLGVLSLGVTWNQANLCCDGIGESRGGGLTELGFEVVRFNNDRGILTDVSHISLAGFDNVLDVADYPIATHSNAMSKCGHRRNLNDRQIKRLIERQGIIGVVFNPPFIGENENMASIAELMTHIDYIYSMGGGNCISLGSDFDGISSYVKDLSHAGEYQNLIQALLQRYEIEVVEGFAWKNAHRYLSGITT
ncbi:dipeptidase [Salisediminibacterium beveridgei]|uniref:Dipeptidase n=1 Tax=Salisediminibacterium beveridgei TaxID=632773 RepID=A0A1D7QV40_9BACI|nr:dipeptidase [Salisediminibacterium beveridgei]AOM82884.1 dipeptidase [Salisediminibacterium beveridgei]